MSILERFQVVIIFLGVGIGIFLGKVAWIQTNAGDLILIFILLMLYSLFLTIPVKDLKKSFKQIKFFSSTLMINFIWTPFFAWLLGAIFLREHPTLWIGFIMLCVTPCTDWYLVFTRIAKGNVPLAASVLPANLILQILLLPVYLLIFAGVMGTLDVSVIVESVLFILFIPFVLAILTRVLIAKLKNGEQKQKKLFSMMGNAQVLFLGLVILTMFASQGEYLLQNLDVVLLLALPILLFYMVNFLLGEGTAKLLRFSYAQKVSLSTTILARNSPTSLAIALIAFPEYPLIALTLVIGPLIELPLLAIVTQIHVWKRKIKTPPPKDMVGTPGYEAKADKFYKNE